MNLNNIPKEMQSLPQWACYRSFLDTEKGKYKKVIISPITKEYAKSNAPETWASYEEAKAFYLKYKYDGLTFVLTSGIVFIDIDHAIVDDEIISEEAQQLLSLLPDTFAERSVSGSGIHILFKGNLPENALKRNDAKGLEMYDTRRFVCMTGNLIGENIALADYSEKTEELNYTFIGKRKIQTFRQQVCELSDSELIEKISASKQGTKFKNLYSGSTVGYETHSSADYALASILAWWTQDFNQVDRIFRSSGLMREKWNRPTGGSTYGANLINSVLGNLPINTYKPKSLSIAPAESSQM